mgnify:CR=1 FL=1
MSTLPPFSALQTARMNYKPLVPEILNQLKSIKFHADFLVKEEKILLLAMEEDDEKQCKIKKKKDKY